MRRAALLAIALALCTTSPAAGYDPDAVSPSEPNPAQPAPSEPTALQSTYSTVSHPPDLYRVTDAYAGDTVLRTGNAISYTTLTTPVQADAYARVLGTVASGELSPWDSLAFNGRGALTDGRPIAGTFYENFIREGDRFLSWSVVL
jgi:hypothetical protein